MCIYISEVWVKPYAPVLPKIYVTKQKTGLVAINLGHFLGIEKASDVQLNSKEIIQSFNKTLARNKKFNKTLATSTKQMLKHVKHY